jgi:integrase
MMADQGESLKYIQDQLGHASIQTTIDRYGHLFPEVRLEAAERLEQNLFGRKVRRRNQI